MAARTSRHGSTVLARAPANDEEREVLTTAPSSRQPDARVDDGVQEVDREVHGDEDEREDEDAGLDHREVPGGHGLHDETPKPRPREDGFDDDGAAQHEAQAQPAERDEGDGGVTERVTVQDEALRHSLG